MATRAITRRYDRALGPWGIRTTQYSILARLVLDGPDTVSHLAARLVLDRTALGRELQTLARHGLIVFETGEDRRERRASATAEGEAALPRRPARTRGRAAGAAGRARRRTAARPRRRAARRSRAAASRRENVLTGSVRAPHMLCEILSAMRLASGLALGLLALLPASSSAALPRLRAVIVSATSGVKLAETPARPATARLRDRRRPRRLPRDRAAGRGTADRGGHGRSGVPAGGPGQRARARRRRARDRRTATACTS